MENNSQILNQSGTYTQPKKTSRWAIASLILGILGFAIPVLAGMPGLIFGLMGLMDIGKSNGLLKGKKLAIAGMVISCITLFWSILIVFGLSNQLRPILFAPSFEKTGGYKILYEMVSSEQPGPDMIDETCDIIQRRLDPTKMLGVSVNPAENKCVEICVPVSGKSQNRLSNPEDLKRMLKGSGALEFRVLPGADELDASRYIESLTAKGPQSASDARYIWCEVNDPAGWHNITNITGKYEDRMYVLASNLDGEIMTRSGETWKLKKAYPTTDMEGRHAIGFAFDQAAADRFYKLTSNNIDKPLCILLDNIAISAPNISSAISSSGLITGGRGGFTPTQVDDMVYLLNAGVLPVPVRPIENSIEWTKKNRQ